MKRLVVLQEKKEFTRRLKTMLPEPEKVFTGNMNPSSSAKIQKFIRLLALQGNCSPFAPCYLKSLPKILSSKISIYPCLLQPKDIGLYTSLKHTLPKPHQLQ